MFSSGVAKQANTFPQKNERHKKGVGLPKRIHLLLVDTSCDEMKKNRLLERMD